MPNRNVPYASLKEYVARQGGTRLCLHGKLRDSLVDIAVAEFPDDAPEDRMAEVLAARVKIRAREKYGSVIAMILIGVLVNLITKLVVEWWRNRKSHRVVMKAWKKSAQKASNISPPDEGTAAT